MTPVRVQLSRKRGWRMPENTVKVDRSTKWGNPYLVERMAGRELWDPEKRSWLRGLHSVRLLGGPFYYEAYIKTKAQAAERAVKLFAEGVAPRMDLSDLRGKSLACWCSLEPGTPCHADILLELANAESAPSSPKGTT